MIWIFFVGEELLVDESRRFLKDCSVMVENIDYMENYIGDMMVNEVNIEKKVL